MTRPPPAPVVAAFGGSGTPAPMPGGRGLAWQANDIVLLDNWCVVHGREGLEPGTPREIKTCWGDAVWLRARPPKRL